MIIIIITNILASIFLLTDLNIQTIKQTWDESSIYSESFEIPDVFNATDAIKDGNLIYIQLDERVVQWDLQKDKLINGIDIPQQSIINISDDILNVCSWNNFEISDPSQFSTLITLRRYDNGLNPYTPEIEGLDHTENPIEIKVFKTIRPILCGADSIEAISAYPIFDLTYYKVDVSSGQYTEIDNPSKQYESNQNDEEEVEVTEEGKIVLKRRSYRPILNKVGIFIREMVRNITSRE